MHSRMALPPPLPHQVPALRADPAVLPVDERHRQQRIHLLHPWQQRPPGKRQRPAQAPEPAGTRRNIADVAVVEVGHEQVPGRLVQPPYHPPPEPAEHRHAERPEHPEEGDWVGDVSEDMIHGPEEG
eukprot:749224-Hanusia_phi.AAC.1